MEQDKTAKFLDEMHLKLSNYTGTAPITSETTGKAYLVRLETKNGLTEASVEATYEELGCTEKRLLTEANVDLGFDNKSFTVRVRKNGFDKKVESPEYWRIKGAIDAYYNKEAQNDKKPPPMWKLLREEIE